MKDLLNKNSFLILFFLTLNINAKNPFPNSYVAFLEDCDACGCSNNGGSLGLGGVIDNNFIGVRYLHQKYQSKDGIFNNSPKINEYFNTIQLWSRIPIWKDYLEVQVFVPLHFHSREYTDRTTRINGLGDASFLLNYTLFNQKKSNYNKEKDKVSSLTHLLKIGTGLKLPIGEYNGTIENAVNPSFQLGTGSWDVITNIQYVLRYNNIGITNYWNYYIKTTNDESYKFGNQFNFNSTFFYVWKDAKNNNFVPSLGISGEFYDSNETFGVTIKDTKGHALFSTIGVEYNLKKISFGALVMYPIEQNLAEGTIDVKYRSSIYFNFNF
jgi:hypothetical protein